MGYSFITYYATVGLLVGPMPNINIVGHPMCIDYIANN